MFHDFKFSKLHKHFKGNKTSPSLIMEDDGFLVSDNGHVDVRYRGWSDVEPSIWTLRDKVKSLDLSYNNLQSLPEEIRNIRRLIELNCEINQINQLPENIGKLRSLKVLKLSSNRLSTIPDAIGNCCNLKELHLDNNEIEILPKTIGNCINLETLKLQNNSLKDLPITFGRLADALKDVDVSNNPDLAIIPEHVQGDTHSIMWIVTLRYKRTNELKVIRQAIQDIGEIYTLNDERKKVAKKKMEDLNHRKRELVHEREEVWFYLKIRHIYRILEYRTREVSRRVKRSLNKRTTSTVV